jgi:hypothetical protein
MAENLEFGLDTFGDITMGSDGQLLSHAQVVRNVIEEAVLATRSVWTASALASTTDRTSEIQRRDIIAREGDVLHRTVR